MEENSQSYRQVGTKSFGRVKRGFAQHHTSRTATPLVSIPGKYETVLNCDNHEENGFGNRTYRFGDNDNELPGPGTYSGIPTDAVSESVSKLGFGVGFVSKSNRFGEEVNSELTPGPGQYTPSSFVKQSYNARTGMTGFATPSLKKGNHVPETTPGPGSYTLRKKYPRTNASTTGSVFTSKSRRGSSTTNIGTSPAPGQYDNPLQIGMQQTRAPYASFRSKVHREMPSLYKTPGPGAYNQETAEKHLWSDTVSTGRVSSMFHTHAGRRTGLVRPSEPGPGSYTPSIALNSTALTSSSMFKSSSRRSNEKVALPPGPAFYTPSRFNMKKSHHMNMRKRWL